MQSSGGYTCTHKKKTKMREGSGDEVSIGEGEGLDGGMELLGGLKKVLWSMGVGGGKVDGGGDGGLRSNGAEGEDGMLWFVEGGTCIEINRTSSCLFCRR